MKRKLKGLNCISFAFQGDLINFSNKGDKNEYCPNLEASNKKYLH